MPATMYAATYHYSNQSDLIGSIQYHRVARHDTWDSIGYFYDVGYDELRHANPKVRSLSRNRGKTIIIPTLHILPAQKYRNGLVVNLAEKRLYYFIDSTTVVTYPVSIGKVGWQTPSFNATIRGKKVAPSWYVPESIKAYYLKKYNKKLPKIVGPGPDNPLGNYAIYLTKPRILIHGTNSEKKLGSAVSSGCVRMYNRNIQELFYLVRAGTPVYFIHQDEKLGIHNSDIYYEKHEPYYDDDPDMIYRYLDQMQDVHEDMLIDKDLLRDVHDLERGVPKQIGVLDDEDADYL